jgi:hypothetical protein
MTILCSPKVTQHHGEVKCSLPPANACSCPRARQVRTASPAVVRLLVFLGARMPSHALNTLRASGADDRRTNRTPVGVDEIAGLALPWGKSCSSCGSLYPSTNGSFLPSAEVLPSGRASSADRDR